MLYLQALFALNIAQIDGHRFVQINEVTLVETIEVTISSAETITTKALDKAIRNAIPTGKLFVQTVSSKHVETLYGMTEADFIKFAKVLPPRTKVDTEVE